MVIHNYKQLKAQIVKLHRKYQDDDDPHKKKRIVKEQDTEKEFSNKGTHFLEKSVDNE